MRIQKSVSDACSGIDQDGSVFAQVLGQGFEGRAATLSSGPATEEPVAEPVADDPLTSPYPIWSEEDTYVTDTRVVWHSNVYEAKWWTKDDVPDNPVLQAAETPWTLIGPVLPGEKPLEVVTVPAGAFPDWNPKTVYVKGKHVMLDGLAFEARWWTSGESPEAALQGSDGSPWIKLSNEQVRDLIGKKKTDDAGKP